MKKFFVSILLVLGLPLLGALAWIYGGWSELHRRSYSDLSPEQFHRFQVPKGIHLGDVIISLGGERTESDLFLMIRLARFSRISQIKAGFYQLSESGSLHEHLTKISQGKVAQGKLTVVEGWNRWQVREAWERDGWLEAKEFDRLCDDTELLEEFQLPGKDCEGFLFPETYLFSYGIAPKEIFRALYGKYKAVLSVVSTEAGTFGPLNLSELEFVTLASIIEKETGQAKERPRIACVFYNRLRSKPPWRLETDPTVIYAARLSDPEFDGNLKGYHLRKMNHPYNTYLNKGLPPGPIANVSLDAMQAVITPEKCGDFFFVSKNNGEHIFCPTLSCHNRAVQRWQVNYFRRKKKNL
ncbi:MAG: endolytic transglycosylase MltG [Myxococcota bacterium]|nr:endolytic transglycosylase MltG [Myxococcota bacterium]